MNEDVKKNTIKQNKKKTNKKKLNLLGIKFTKEIVW